MQFQGAKNCCKDVEKGLAATIIAPLAAKVIIVSQELHVIFQLNFSIVVIYNQIKVAENHANRAIKLLG